MVTTALMLLLPFFAFFVFPTTGNEPGIKVRITDKGLNYTNYIGELLLNSEIRTLKKIPDYQYVKKGFRVETKNVIVTDYRDLYLSYALRPPNAIQWSTAGGSITVQGACRVVDWVVARVTLDESFTAVISNIQLSITVSVRKDADGKPVVDLLSCDAEVASVDIVKIEGNLSWIVKWFRKDIEKAIKKAIHNPVCNLAQTVLVTNLNRKLKSLPMKVNVGEFTFDYSLNADPVIAKWCVEASFTGSISWRNESASAIVGPPLPKVLDSSDRMIYIWGSDYIFNTLLYSAHVHNASRTIVDQHSFPEIAPWLRTTCPGQICMGSISSEIPKKYPNAFTLLEFQTSSAPSVAIEPGETRLNASIRAKMYVEPRSDKNLLLVFDIVFEGDFAVNLNGSRLTGNLTIDQFTIHINESNVGDISPTEIDMLAAFAKPFLQNMTNTYLNEGVLIPPVANIDLPNAEVALLERAIQIDGDVKYNYKPSSK